MKTALFSFLLLCTAQLSQAQVVADVDFPENLPANTLHPKMKLNGAALRELYLLVDTYAGALYLEEPSQSASQIIASEQHKTMIFHVLLDKVSARRLSSALHEALLLNISKHQHRDLQSDINTMLSYFSGSLKKGQQAVFHYIPNHGTQISVAGKVKGLIAGKDFYNAMLKVWIGKSPVTRAFKDNILGL